jgi:DNA polymerase elongation subunit (family B)
MRRLVEDAAPPVKTGPRYLNGWWDRDGVVFVERKPDGGVAFVRSRTEHICYIKRADYERVSREIRDSKFFLSANVEGDWVRVGWRERELAKKACRWLERERKVQTYDGDVSPMRRVMVERDIRIEAPRTCYLDIETDSRVPFSKKEEMRVLCWTVIAADGTAFAGVLPEDTDEAERVLLGDLFDLLARFDRVVSWNGDRFDFPVIKERAARRGVDVTWRRWLWLDHLVLFRRLNSADSGEEKQSFALGAIAHSVLGEGKDAFDASKTWEEWEAGGDRRDAMVRYCSKDSDLMRRIENETGFIALLDTLCDACGVFPDTAGINPTSQVESFLLRLARARAKKFPTKHEVDPSTAQYLGAFVMPPKLKGILKNVHVADFASLYPSIILSWNMSPDSKATEPLPGQSVAPGTGVRFDNDPLGLLAEALGELLRLRKHWNALAATLPPGTPEWKDAMRRSTAYKVAANSFYGVIGSLMSRFYDREVAESITQAGVWLIKETIKAAEARGWEVVYGDTDSIFVLGCTRSEFAEFVEWCNVSLYPPLLVSVGCTRNHVKLAYEKEHARIVFVTAKRYVGFYAHYKGTLAAANSKPEVKGLEYKRGDVVKLARDMQSAIVSMLRDVDEPAHYHALVERWRDRVLNEPLALAEVVVSKRLNKPLNGYATKQKKDGTRAAQLPHIEVGHLLAKRGRDVGEGAKIEFVVVDGKARPKKVIPAEDWTGKCDRYELWDSLVWPASERLLASAFVNEPWAARWGGTRPKAVRAPKGAPRAVQRPRKRAVTAPTSPDPGSGSPRPRRRLLADGEG